MTAPRETTGILLRIASTLGFALMAACVKALGAAVPLGQVVFFRSALALIPLVAFLAMSGDFPHGLKTTRPVGHILRCLMGALAMFTSFATLRLLPLAEAQMLSYLAPVLMVVLAWGFLGERPSVRRGLGVAFGLAGALAFTLPALSGARPEGALLGLGFGLLTAALTAAALIQVRRLTVLGEKPGAIAFWFAVVSALAGLATAPFGWVSPSPTQLALLLGAGIAGGFAHILMTLSFRHAEASALAPYEYLTVLWAVMIGLLAFHELPGWSFALAAPLILAGAVVAAPSARSGGRR